MCATTTMFFREYGGFERTCSKSINSLIPDRWRNPGKAGYFLALNPAKGEGSWRPVLPDEPAYCLNGQLDHSAKLRFTHAGATAYTAADPWEKRHTYFGYFYALNTQPGTSRLTSRLCSRYKRSGEQLETFNATPPSR